MKRIPLSLVLGLALLAFVTNAKSQTQETKPASPKRSSQKPGQQSPAQTDQDAATLRIDTALVQTDVTVVNKKGQFVDGLRRDEFEVKVDGKPQPISFFDRVTVGAAEEEEKLAAARGETLPASAARTATERGMSVIFFVDDFHLSPEKMQRAKELVNKYLDRDFRAIDQGLIVTATGQLGFLQQFTGNRAVLRAAAARLKYAPFEKLDTQSPSISYYEALAIDRNEPGVLNYKVREYKNANGLDKGGGPPAAIRSPVFAGGQDPVANVIRQRALGILQQGRQYNLSLLSALESTVRNTAGVPGRKILFFLSEGFLVDYREREMTARFERVIDTARRANVVFYTVDARGLTVGMVEADTAGFPTPLDSDPTALTIGGGDLALNESQQKEQTMRGLAYDTGGRPIINTNAQDKRIEQVLDEYQNYYLLAWQPEEFEPGKTKFRKIEVRVKDRPDLKVLVRRGFYDAPPPPLTSEKTGKPDEKTKAKPESESNVDPTVTGALRAVNPSRDLPFALFAAFRNETDQGSFIAATVELPTAAFTSEGKNAEVELVYVALDVNGKLVNSGGKKLNLTGNSNDAAMRNGKLVSQFVVPATASGIYQLRVAARNTATGKVGTQFEWVEAPEFKPGKFAVSSLLLSERPAQKMAANAKGGTNTEEVLLNVGRRFARSSRLLLQLYLYNPAHAANAKPEITMEIDVLKREKSVLNAPPHPAATAEATDPNRILYSAEIPLRGLTPGLYTLRVKATDKIGKTEEIRSINFIVE